MINVFIIGARGYTKKYGGWETLVHGIIDNQIDSSIKYYVFEVVSDKNEEKEFEVDGVTCIRFYVKQTNAFQMIFGDIIATKYAVKYIKKNNLENPVLLTLGARIGPILWGMRPYIKSSKAVIMENPGGVEWKRPKWGLTGQIYQYISCYFTGIASDYIISDSEGIRDIYKKMVKSDKHIKEYAAYGVYPITNYNPEKTEKTSSYFNEHGLEEDDYYLIINRFMPENSYELILSEYVKSKTRKKLVLVTNIDKENSYYKELSKKIPFEKDDRIKFVGTMYDPDILLYLRLHAFAYINGHTLGGTNPGLLEAMYSTGFVLAYDVVFSREVCDQYALYYDKKHTLCETMIEAENLPPEKKMEIIRGARKRMEEKYSWHDVTEKYEKIFKGAFQNNVLGESK